LNTIGNIHNLGCITALQRRAAALALGSRRCSGALLQRAAHPKFSTRFSAAAHPKTQWFSTAVLAHPWFPLNFVDSTFKAKTPLC
jgi:hypothetical protein